MTGLQFGSQSELLIRLETIGRLSADPWRLLYASDLHLTARRSHLVQQLHRATQSYAFSGSLFLSMEWTEVPIRCKPNAG